MGYNILRSHSPEEFFIALAIGLLLKSNTAIGPTIPEICPIECLTLKHIQNFQRKFGKKSFWQNFSQI